MVLLPTAGQPNFLSTEWKKSGSCFVWLMVCSSDGGATKRKLCFIFIFGRLLLDKSSRRSVLRQRPETFIFSFRCRCWIFLYFRQRRRLLHIILGRLFHLHAYIRRDDIALDDDNVWDMNLSDYGSYAPDHPTALGILECSISNPNGVPVTVNFSMHQTGLPQGAGFDSGFSSGSVIQENGAKPLFVIFRLLRSGLLNRIGRHGPDPNK